MPAKVQSTTPAPIRGGRASITAIIGIIGL